MKRFEDFNWEFDEEEFNDMYHGFEDYITEWDGKKETNRKYIKVSDADDFKFFLIDKGYEEVRSKVKTNNVYFIIWNDVKFIILPWSIHLNDEEIVSIKK